MATAPSTVGSVTGEQQQQQQQQRDEPTQSFPPSHILQDGRHIYLPPASEAEKQKFLERSIARHHLLESNLSPQQDKQQEEKKDTTQPTIHPLAVASARLQANGISELSKAINLSGLVSTGEYFGLANIVDPSLEVSADKTETPQKVSTELADEQRLQAEYIGKRKRTQFEEAANVLERHERRMAAALTAQSVMDERFKDLRPHWRLVAPEHGTRAQPHAARPSELVAIDVDVYDRDRTGGGNQAVLGRSSTMGRIARRVPRFATIELQDDYKVNDDLVAWKEQHSVIAGGDDDDDDMKVESVKDDTTDKSIKTRAEPFAVADPTLGKIDVDFDPDKVPMLTLQFDISKPSTGFLQSTRLSPLTGHDKMEGSDESVVVSLQHSLFCASLFESIRRELVPEDDGDKTVGSVASKSNRTVWLSSEMDENFLPPPSLMAGGDNSSGGVRTLAVVHCHEGEVMVQLDCEYSLTVKLVEAGTPGHVDADAMEVDDASDGNAKANSGSQTPEQLEALCRALLLHAQDVYHDHSMKARAKALYKEEQQAPGLARIQKKDKMPPARILESCVNLGAKMIFERKIRRALKVSAPSWVALYIQKENELKIVTNNYKSPFSEFVNGQSRRSSPKSQSRWNGFHSQHSMRTASLPCLFSTNR